MRAKPLPRKGPLLVDLSLIELAVSEATVPVRGDLHELEEIIRIADRRLYRAKAGDRNRVCVT